MNSIDTSIDINPDVTTATVDGDLLTDPAPAAGAETGIPFTRLVRVEARKLLDTRAGLWLAVSVAAAVCAVAAAGALLIPAEQVSWAGLASVAGLPVALLVPVIAILTLTSEWTQRTALVTFALEPRRGRVVAAKLVVLVGLVLASTVLVAVAGAGGTLLSAAVAGGSPVWDLGPAQVGGLAVLLAVNVAFGAALGLLLMNSAAAIVTFFALPTVLSMAAALSEPVARLIGWINLNETTGVLLAGGDAGQWARLAVSLLVMVVIPMVAGVIRTLRREIA